MEETEEVLEAVPVVEETEEAVLVAGQVVVEVEAAVALPTN